MPFRIEAAQVAYQYPQSDRGLPPVSLTVSPGEFLHVAGVSGSGKSTLARCLTGMIPHLYRGTLHGSISIDGLATRDHPLWQLAEHAGMVFQNPAAQMLGVSVEDEIIFGLENLGLPRDEIGARLEEALARFGLAAMRGRIPQTMSGGEQQKLALAAIMARRPSTLVLDEPFSMLDVTAATELVERLTDLSREGTSVVVFEHRAEFLDGVPGLRRLSLNGAARPALPEATSHTALQFRQPPEPLTLSAAGVTVQLGGRAVLRSLDLTVRGGETVAIVGRNGVGKTTLLRALGGLVRYDGSIDVNGERPDLGLVFQNADLQLFNASVRDEILYRVDDPDMALYEHLLDVLGLARYESTPPLLLSEGEKKRVALATVLLRQPRHGVLLDEPSLGQDVRHKHMLLHVARALNRAGQVVIMTTHDLTLAAGADRIILLGADGFVADGPPGEVFADSSAWASIGLYVPDWLYEDGRLVTL